MGPGRKTRFTQKKKYKVLKTTEEKTKLGTQLDECRGQGSRTPSKDVNFPWGCEERDLTCLACSVQQMP